MKSVCGLMLFWTVYTSASFAGPNLCNLPKYRPGHPRMCLAMIPRFYFDQSTKACKLFYYGGCGATANHFKTLEECKQKCGGGTIVSGPMGPCAKEAARIKAILSKHMIEDLVPPSCNVDGTYKSIQCNPMVGCWCVTKDGKDIHGTLAKEGKPTCSGPNPCNLPKYRPGLLIRCRAHIPMFYFDQSTKACKQFYYSGCGATANNFQTLEECKQKCGGGTSVSGPMGPCAKEAARIKAMLSNSKHIIADLVPPSCNADGTYKSIQCHPLIGCWCVTEDGIHIPGTYTKNGVPICPIPY